MAMAKAPARRRRRRTLLLVAAVVAGAALLSYAALVEPYWIEVTRHRVKARLASPLKIAHVSDLHTRGVNRRERTLLKILEDEKPDMIVITGDSLDRAGTAQGYGELLRHFHAPLGVWVVKGNHECWNPIPNEREFYRSAGVNFLLNESAKPRDDLWLIGFDDAFGGSPDVAAAVAGVPSDAYRVALFHSPGFFDQAAPHCDIALAGHTHGGQVRLPLVGALWLPPHSGGFESGWFERDGARMYVSRGLGTSLVGLRFNCRPELAIITLEN